MADAENNQPNSTSAQPHDTPRPSVAEAVTELVQMSVDYVRQETGDVVHDKVVVPTQKAGRVVAFALVAAFSLILGIAFLSAAVLVLLGPLIGWAATLFLVGGLLVLGAAGFTYLRMRSMQ